MDPYERALRDYFRLACELWLARVERALWEFAHALDAWLNDLIEHPTPRWRESLEAFLAQQKSAGRIPKPESRNSILNYLYAWSKTVDWGAVARSPRTILHRSGHQGGPAGIVQAPTENAARPRAVKTPAKAPHRPTQTEIQERFFNANVAEAQRRLGEMRQLLEALGQKLDAAKIDEEVDVETEVDAIEGLIWLHNDAIESAQEAWLREDLSREAIGRLQSLPTPASLGLPMFFDADQTARLNHQGMQISARLAGRDATMGWIIGGAKVVEGAGNLAGIAVGAGVVLNALRTGGKWAVVKTVAIGGAAIAAEQGVEHGLRAVGANETVVRGFRLAVAVASFIILKRRLGSSSGQQSSPSAPQPPTAPAAKAPVRSTPSRPEASRGVLKSPRGRLNDVARDAAAQPHRPGSQVPASRTKTFPPIEGKPDAPRTREHTILQKAIGEEMQATGDYVKLGMGRPLSEYSGLKHTPDIEPDNIGLTAEGTIDMFEIVSPTQSKQWLMAKLERALEQLPPHMRGGISVVDPADAFK